MAHQTIASIQKALPSNSSKDLMEFSALFYGKVPQEDIDLLDTKDAVQIVSDHWSLAKSRKAKECCVVIKTPESKDQNNGHTYIDIVHDDMAFLIDSVVAEIVRQNQLIQYLIHPLLYIKRSSKALSYQEKNDDEHKGQMHIHIELDSRLAPAQSEELELGLRKVIQDVENATSSWILMREKFREAQKSLSSAPPQYDDTQIEEYQAFLEYLYDNNFTLLGYRAYSLKAGKDGTLKSSVVKGSSLGLLHDDIKPVYINQARKKLTDEQQRLRYEQQPLVITKVNQRSTVHRRVPLDAVAVKTYDKNGKVDGELLFIGLFTSVTYSRSVADIPLVRKTVQNILNRSGFPPGSHDRKALRHILERYPRDEVLQIDEDNLFASSVSILRLQERPRLALYARPDLFGRYISCLVFVPRDRYDTRLRHKLQAILEEELDGVCTSFTITQDDSPLARLIYLIDINHLEKIPSYDFEKIEAKLEEEGRLWSERLRTALVNAQKEDDEIAAIITKYGQAFPVNYHDHYSAKQAVHDIRNAEQVLETEKVGLDLHRPKDCELGKIRLKIFNCGEPVTLSEILPILENMGLRVITERPFEIHPDKENKVIWIHDFLVEIEGTDESFSVEAIKAPFEQALEKVWYGHMEDDGLNRLVFHAEMGWRDITILRACIRYLRQTRYPFSLDYMERALTENPVIAKSIIKLFEALHNPDNQSQSETLAAGCAIEIDHALEKVESLDQDRILRALTELVEATLRTNFYQPNRDPGQDGEWKTYLSLKLDSAKVPNLPNPKPYREIFVYSPRVEGVHLRGDVIARGGLRWSDRHEDFRTEILGLMKAQMVKNSVIVPMGAKGGFVVKNPPKEREAFFEEGVSCYKIFIQGLLDITDNLKGDAVIPPDDVVRRDGDDPYLVVAADKGTATFSDIANGISQDYDFWMGDAFASGGSAGYDHKKMGITARGAWESVKRHFRELNHDTQTEEFDVIGIGDMGGDVFGNGMLLSEHIRLIGAFNHLHIFCDPDPDPAASFKERKRLFDDVKGWDSYDTKKLSKGGMIFLRKDKNLKLTPEIQKRFDIETASVTPNELMRAMLKARTDLLWFGGIGTYIKAEEETHADVGDKANDAIRINAKEVRSKVIGEGANLGVTLEGRISYANAGGKVNADFIDNSGGVDSSDHEVNIKILLGDVMDNAKSKMTLEDRNKLLESMTDEIADHVLRNNYQQAQAISLMELSAHDVLPLHEQLIKELERDIGLDRKLEGLPSPDVVEERMRQGRGLNRTEISVLQAYAKIRFAQSLLNSDIPDSKAAHQWLVYYFPKPLREKYEKEILRHRLRREIVATSMSNSFINRMGATFVKTCMDKTGANVAEIAKAYMIVREVFGLRGIWEKIENLDGKVPAQSQLISMQIITTVAERAVMWFLTRIGRDLNIDKDTENFAQGIALVKKNIDKVLTPDLKEKMDRSTQDGVHNGLPKALAHDIAQMPLLSSACDMILISESLKTDIPITVKTYFEVGQYFHLDWLRQKAKFLHSEDRWTAEALDGLVDQLYGCQAGLTMRILKDLHKDIKDEKFAKTSIIEAWVATHQHHVELVEPLFVDLQHAANIDIPMLIIAEQRLRSIYGG